MTKEQDSGDDQNPQPSSNDSPSFYPDKVDNSSQLAQARAFVKEITALTARGPFVDEEGRVAIRGFGYKDVTLFAFLVEETEDSFIVILPASLSRDEQGVKATKIIPTPMARLLKTQVGFVCLPTPLQQLYYLSLTIPQASGYTGYFTNARIAQLSLMVEALKIALGVEKVPGPEEEAASPPVAKKKRDVFTIPDELIPRIQH